MPLDRLSTYLSDHYAASVGAAELVRQSTEANRGTALGRALDRLATELEEDRAALATVMDELGTTPDTVRAPGGWLAEKLGVLKLNGRPASSSPLGRLEELEVLALGVEGKLRLWLTLERAECVPDGIIDLRALINRARSQLERLERYRLDAVEEAF